jgi:hypothetical protein
MDVGLSKTTYKALTNESKVRLVAGFVLLLSIIFILTGKIWIPMFLMVDFGLRAFGLGRYSPISFISGLLVRALNLPVKPVYLPPKQFAARIGFVFSLTILLLSLASVDTFFVVSILAVFAALESFAGFCAGCYVYHFLHRFRRS